MSILVSLTPSESKRLIGKALAKHPLVQSAFQNGKIMVSGGTTTAFFIEELLGEKIDPSHFACGVITKGLLCVTPEERIRTIMTERGTRLPNDRSLANPVEIHQQMESLMPGDLYIKGANAIDRDGMAGFLLAHNRGGNVLQALQQVYAMGIPFLIPTGLEKLVPSVIEAQRNMHGIANVEYSFGRACGYAAVSNGMIFHELEALKLLTGVSGTHVASGGFGGSEGSVVLTLEGTPEQKKAAIELLKEIKGEPATPSWKGNCRECASPCSYMSELLNR